MDPCTKSHVSCRWSRIRKLVPQNCIVRIVKKQVMYFRIVGDQLVKQPEPKSADNHRNDVSQQLQQAQQKYVTQTHLNHSKHRET